MKATSHGADDLQDVLQEFIEAVERPDAATLDEFVRKYPHYAAELTDFAAEWLLEELSPSEVLSSDEQHAAVSHAMSYLQNRLYEMERTRTEQGGDPTKVAPLFAQWTPTEFKCLADALGVKKPEVAKIRDRKIEADTIPI